ncbi:hypothetical protein WME94_55740 [Sorangium sp. So ce429]
MNQHVRCALSALVAAVAASAAGPARAEVSIYGDVLPANPTDPWDLGASSLRVADGYPDSPLDDPSYGEVLVADRGTMISAGAFIGGTHGLGSVSVEGYGSRWTNHGTLEVGAGSSGWGILRVQRGAQVTTDTLVVSSSESYRAYGVVFVNGYDATLTTLKSTYIGNRWGGELELRQGARFFSNNVYFGVDPSATVGSRPVRAAVVGSLTRWVNTGDFIVGTGRAGQLSVYRGELTTVNAQVLGDPRENSHVSVSGWGGTWTNGGLLTVGSGYGYGQIDVGAYGTLATDHTEIRSQLGEGYIHLKDVYGSFINRGDVTIFASTPSPEHPSLLIDGGGAAVIGGLLRTAPLPDVPGGPSSAVRLVNGSLTAGAIEAQGDALDFVGGRLDTGSFVGDLVNTQLGELVVGEVHDATFIAGSYSQGGLASLRITVAGPSAAPLLDVDGDISLGGTLEVGAGDEPASFQAGDTVALFGWGGALTGAFSAVNIALPLAPGLAWDTSALYTTGEITVVPA